METEIDLVVYEYLASPCLPELFDESSVKPLMIKLRPTYDILKNKRTSCKVTKIYPSVSFGEGAVPAHFGAYFN